MTVWSVDKNPEAKTMVITAEFNTSITNVWQLWADPRLLERWWGPPGFAATFELTTSRRAARSPILCPAPTAATGSRAPGT